jgi:hypothetical protein
MTSTPPARGVRAWVAHRFHRSEGRRDEADLSVAHLSHEGPDPVEWDESLIGIEPNSGGIEPPTIC